MTATGFIRGHPVHFDGEWRYEDGSAASHDRPCPKCGEPPTPEGYDACIGHVPGASSVCCGHGMGEPYIVREGGKREPLDWNY